MPFDPASPLAWAVPAAWGLLLLAAALAGWRLWRGPRAVDRVVALDLLAGLSLCGFVLVAVATGQTVFLDVAVGLAVLSFLGTVAAARFLGGERGAGE